MCLQCGSRCRGKKICQYFPNKPAFFRPFIKALHPDPHWDKKLDPDPHWGKKLDPDPHWNPQHCLSLICSGKVGLEGKKAERLPGSRGQINSPWLGDIVDSGIGLSYRPSRLHWLAGRYESPTPESTIFLSQGLRIWLLGNILFRIQKKNKKIYNDISLLFFLVVSFISYN